MATNQDQDPTADNQKTSRTTGDSRETDPGEHESQNEPKIALERKARQIESSRIFEIERDLQRAD